MASSAAFTLTKLGPASSASASSKVRGHVTRVSEAACESARVCSKGPRGQGPVNFSNLTVSIFDKKGAVSSAGLEHAPLDRPSRKRLGAQSTRYAPTDDVGTFSLVTGVAKLAAARPGERTNVLFETSHLKQFVSNNTSRALTRACDARRISHCLASRAGSSPASRLQFPSSFILPFSAFRNPQSILPFRIPHTLRMSRRKSEQFHKNLSGGLPFETPTGRKQPARPLCVRKRALSAKQAEKEDDHLISYFVWTRQWEHEYPQLAGRLCFHTENERLLAPITVTRAGGEQVTYGPGYQQRQRKGVKRGVVDVLNLRPSRRFFYLAGELKVRDGDLTDEQSEFIAQARAAGAFAHTFWCWSELARATMWFFRLTDRRVYLSAGDPRDYLLPDLGGHDKRCGCNWKLANAIRFVSGAEGNQIILA